MLFHQDPCKKSQKGVNLYRQKPQKDAEYNKAEISKRCR